MRCSKKWRVRLESESGELEIFLDSTEEDDNFSAEYTLRIRRKYRDGTTRSEHWMCDLSHGGWSAGWGMPSLETLPFHPNLEGYTFDFTVTVYDCNLQHEEVFSYNREVIGNIILFEFFSFYELKKWSYNSCFAK